MVLSAQCCDIDFLIYLIKLFVCRVKINLFRDSLINKRLVHSRPPLRRFYQILLLALLRYVLVAWYQPRRQQIVRRV